jgi:hypothetical protein
MSEMTRELTVTNILKEGADDIGRNNIRVEQPVNVNGRSVYNVYVTEPNGEGQFHILVDADTDLPISMSVDGPKGEEMRMSFEFNGEFDSSYLQPVLPTGVKFERIDRSKMMGEGAEFMNGMKDFHFKLKSGHEEHAAPIDGKEHVRIERAVAVG